MIDDPEEEAWRELELRMRRGPVAVSEAFEFYRKQAGATEDAERHFRAGWAAAIKNQRESND